MGAGVGAGVGVGGGRGERVTRAYTVEVQTTSVFFYAEPYPLEPYGSQAWTH